MRKLKKAPPPIVPRVNIERERGRPEAKRVPLPVPSISERRWRRKRVRISW